MLEFASQLRRSFASVFEELWAGHQHFNYFLGVSAGIAGILFAIWPEGAGLVASVVALLILAYPTVLVARRMSWERSEDVAPPPEIETRRYIAIPYFATNDQDMLELSAFAAKQFAGETIPGPVMLQAVRCKSVLGLRLTTEDRRTNLGFLDIIHFRKDILQKWLSGEVEEPKLTAADFQPIAKVAPAETLEFAVGALYLKAGMHTRNHHVPSALVAAAMRYVDQMCVGHAGVRLYATIFSTSGDSWAKRVGFKLYQKKETRKGSASKHDVYVLNLAEAPESLDTVVPDGNTFASVADFGRGRVIRYEINLEA
jgi:hypothetical protein